MQIFINPEKNITAEQICSTNFDHNLFIMFIQWIEFFTEEAFFFVDVLLAFSRDNSLPLMLHNAHILGKISLENAG